jgi:hypothetical protein
MNTLKAVNLILQQLNENPLPNLDVQYPTLAIVLSALEEAQAEVLSQGFWFNTRYDVELVPDVLGEVQVPTDCIIFIPCDRDITFEGTRFIDSKTGTEVTEAVRGVLITNLAYESLPLSVRYTVAYLAAYNAYVTDNGEDSTSTKLQNAYMRWGSSLTREHTRARKVNARRNPAVQKWFRYLRT